MSAGELGTKIKIRNDNSVCQYVVFYLQFLGEEIKYDLFLRSIFKVPCLFPKIMAWDSQNFLSKFVRFFLTLGLKILRL